MGMREAFFQAGKSCFRLFSGNPAHGNPPGMIPGSRNMNGKNLSGPILAGKPAGSVNLPVPGISVPRGNLCQFPARRRIPSFWMSLPGTMAWLPRSGIFAVTDLLRNLSMKRWKDSMSSGTILISVYAGSACTSVISTRKDPTPFRPECRIPGTLPGNGGA